MAEKEKRYQEWKAQQKEIIQQELYENQRS